jgi:hypothetical protein
MKKIYLKICVSFLIIFCAFYCNARCSDDVVIGSVIPFNTPSGIVFQVWYQEPLESCTAEDINISTKKAVLKGKAVMANFFKDSVRSSESITQIEKIIKTSNISSQSPAREVAETFVTQIVNNSEHILRGILVEQQKVDCANQYVKIKLVTSPKTRSFSRDLSKEMNSDVIPGGKLPKDTPSINLQNPGDVY